jgi:hypothetical protein
MVWGELRASVEETVIVAEYVPAPSPEVLTETVIFPLPVPEFGVQLNQSASSITAQFMVPVPEVLIMKSWD